MDYNYRKSHKDDYDYKPDIRKDRGYNYKYNEDSSNLDDYTTSAISYDEYIKKPHLNFPRSKSEYGETRRDNNRDNYKRYSPIADYDYFKHGDSTKKWSKRTKNDVQNMVYQFEIEQDKYRKNERRSRSPRRKGDYEDYISEEPEENYQVDKYFEKARLKEKKPKKYTNEDEKGEDRKKNSKRNDYQKKGNEEEFTYKEPKLNEKVYKSREKILKKSPLNSEVEIGNIDYPMLAFKDNVSQGTTSDMVYLPVIVFDKKSKSQESPKHRIQLRQPGNIQVFATNIKDRSKSIFTSVENNNRNDHKLKSQADSELQTEGSSLSRDTKFKEDSTARTSTETQTEESLIFEHNHPISLRSNNTKSIGGSIFQKVEETQTDDSLFFEPNQSKPQTYKNTGSILGSIFEKVELNSKLKDNHSSKEKKRTRKYDSGIKNKNLFAYQIDVDIEPVKKNMYASTVTKADPKNITSQFEYKQIEDTLHDDYPVTKDYIKVSDNSMEQIKAKMFSDITQPSGTPSMTKMPTNLISKNTQNEYAMNFSNSGSKKIKSFYDNNTSKENKKDVITSPNYSSCKKGFVIKDISETYFNSLGKLKCDNEKYREGILKPNLQHGVFDYELDETENRIGYEKNPLDLQSKNLQVFRSTTANRAFNNPLMQSSARKPSQIYDKSSILSEDKNRQPEDVPQPKQEGFNDEKVDEEPDTPKERKSMARKRDSSLVGRKSQFNKFRSNNFNERKQSKSIMRTPFFSRKGSKINNKPEKPVESNNKNTQQENVIPTNNLEQQDEKMSPGNDLVERNSKANKSVIRPSRKSEVKHKTSEEEFSSTKGMSGTEYEEEPMRKSRRQSSGNKLEERSSKERKSEIGQSGESEIKNKPSKKGFSRLFSRSKSKIGTDDKVKPPKKSTRQSKLSYAERDGTSTEDNEMRPQLRKNTSQATPDKKKSIKKGFSRLFSRSKSKIETDNKENPLRKSTRQSKLSYAERGETPTEDDEMRSSQINKSKSKSKIGSFLRRSKTKDEPETGSNGLKPSQEQIPESPSSQVTDEQMQKSEPTDKQQKERQNENKNKEDKQCECVIQYVKQARECSNFFLGTTLHEQIMDILKVI